MKYLFFTNYFYPEQFRGNDIAFELVRKGHRVTVLTCIPNYPEGRFHQGYGLFRRRREIINGVKVIRVPVIPRGSGGSVGMILNYLSGTFFMSLYALHYAIWHHFDAIFVQQLSPVFIGIPAVIVKKIRKTPIVFWILDLWPESLAAGGISNPKVVSAVGKTVDWIYRHCDRLLISSQGFGPVLMKRGVPESKIHYFPNWSEDVLCCGSEDYDLPDLPAGFMLMFAGNLGEAQNLENLLNVALRLSSYKELRWVFVGEGRKRPYMERFIREHRLQDTVYLLGRYPIEAMPAFFKRADVMLVSLCDDPAFNLTLPAKVQAYMSCGKPIVGMLNGEGQAVLQQARCGFAAEAGDVAGMGDAVVRLLNMSPKERTRLGNNGYEYYLANFRKQTCMDRLHKILNDI